MSYRIINADIFDGLQQIEDHSIHCVITSPPYLGLRRYSGITPRQWTDGTMSVLGEEDTVDRYVTHLVEVFRELKRVLHPRGTFWLNLGDCHAGGGRHPERKEIYNIPADGKPVRPKQKGLHGKNLLMVPARAALALQNDGWLLRSDIIWGKGCSFLPSFAGAVMPESAKDRPTHAHEHLFIFALNPNYFYDQDGCREPYATANLRGTATYAHVPKGGDNGGLSRWVPEVYIGQATKDYAKAGAQNPSDTKRRVLEAIKNGAGRNLRDVWIIQKENYPGVHFATFAKKLVEPVVKLATSEKGCCPHCGEQVRRKTIREPVPADVQAAFNAARVTSTETSGRTDGHTRRKPNYRRRVLRTGWEVGCECPGFTIENAVPCRVLDPFVGSGRAGIVAVSLGRDFTGIDASAQYCELASAGIERAARGYHCATDRQPDDVAGCHDDIQDERSDNSDGARVPTANR